LSLIWASPTGGVAGMGIIYNSPTLEEKVVNKWTMNSTRNGFRAGRFDAGWQAIWVRDSAPA